MKTLLSLQSRTTAPGKQSLHGIIKELVRSEWERSPGFSMSPALALKDNAGSDSALLSGIESHSGRSKVFKRLKKIIHCANGMLHIEADGTWKLMPFSPAYYARNPIPIPWDPDATCPKFDALLEFALPQKPKDSHLPILILLALVRLRPPHRQCRPANPALGRQGPVPAKSTIAEVVEMVLGLINCTALRTKLLHERFEIGRLFGFTLLTAKDVPGRLPRRGRRPSPQETDGPRQPLRRGQGLHGQRPRLWRLRLHDHVQRTPARPTCKARPTSKHGAAGS